MPAANSVASKGRIRIEALLRQSRSLAARFALKLGCTVTITSVLATPKISDTEHPFSTTYGTPPKMVLVTVRNPAFHARHQRFGRGHRHPPWILAGTIAPAVQPKNSPPAR
jgi:hypothetical protein